ncbi:MAG: energy-coupling factor transporter ATPase [Lachnospiraceae bacterium]
MSLILNHVNYIYGEDTNLAVAALKDINLVIPEDEFIGLIGHTGSGKSTLVQHLNGLLMPTSGNVYFNGEDIADKDYDRKMLRSKVGLVFQYPEHQLFEVTVFEDVCFGPRNLGLSSKETELRAYEALKQVGISEEQFYHSPFELSGGQKRRVAIAGVLAMKPEILIFDEPTAGLDPKGRNEILNQIRKLKDETGMTIILVSHSMEDVAEYVERIIVMNRGSIIYDGATREVFRHFEELEQIGLAAPQMTYMMNRLKKEGFGVNTDAATVMEAKEEILKALGNSCSKQEG